METILKMIREYKNISRNEFVKKTKVNITDLLHYENRKTIPRDQQIVKIASGLDIEPSMLSLSFGVLSPEFKENIMAFPFYYFDKIKEICENGPKVKEKKTHEIEFLNKCAIANYYEQETSIDDKEVPNDNHT